MGIEGSVLDPQGRGVPNAAITLTCGDVSRFAISNSTGRFRFEPGSREQCSLDVRRPGFDPAFVKLDDQPAGAITIRLLVAPVVAEVRVTAGLRDRSPFGLVLTQDDFRPLANDTDELIRRIQERAGAGGRSRVVYVDGLPASTLPPIDVIERISIDSDPFSAEYAHGDMAAISITTRPPARRLRFYTGGTGINLGGKDVLASGSDRPDVLSGNFGVMGPVPMLPLTFSFTGTGSRNTRVTPVRATLPSDVDAERGDDVTSTNRNIGGGLELNYARPGSTRARLTYREAHFDGRNVGAGELSLAETGAFTQGRSRDFRLTANRIARGRTFELGATATASKSDLRANSSALGISVPGHFTSGGGGLARSSTERASWLVKGVMRSGSKQPWSAGLIASVDNQSAADAANPFGLIEFDSLDSYLAARAGATTGTLFRSQETSAAYRSVTASPFVQKVIWRGSSAELNAGLRGDYQRGFGTLVSPRLSMAATWRGTSFGAGGGLFARDIPQAVVWRTVRDASSEGRQWLAREVSLTNVPVTLDLAGRRLSSQLDPGIARPREWMTRLSIERPIGKITTGLEYSRSIESHLLGARRQPTPDGWLDSVESNRGAARDRLHSQLRFEHRRQYGSLHYEWTRAYDDTDGPWSSAQNSADLASEWARSSRVSPHSVTLSGTFVLPGAISFNVTNAWLSGTPYNVTTGIDVSGNGLRNDRGGRPRNSAQTAASNDLSIYSHRRFTLPARMIPGKRRLSFSVGIHGNNLLNNRNYIALGSVAGTPTFGKPIAAQAGRAMRVTFSLD